MPALLDELHDWLRIPSISTGGGDPADLHRAAEWVRERVARRRRRVRPGRDRRRQPDRRRRAARGRRRRAHRPDLRPLRRAGRRGRAARGARRPFEPEVRDGRLYARGASDDKGNFLPLLHVALRARARGRAAGQRARARRGRGGGRRRVGERWLRADDARRRRRDRLRLRHGGRAHARDHGRRCAGWCSAEIAVRTGRARPALGALRRQRPERAARPARDARRGAARARRPRCATSCARGSLQPAADGAESWARLTPGDEGARRGRRPPGASGRRAPSTTRATAPTRRSTSTRSAAASRARSFPARRAPCCRCGSRRASAPRRWPAWSSGLLRAAAPAGAERRDRLPARRAGALRRRRAGDPAGGRGARARLRAWRRCCMRSGGSIPIVAELGRRGHPDDRQRLRARRRRYPRAERVLPAREPAPRRGRGARAVRRARRAHLGSEAWSISWERGRATRA